MGKKDMEEPNGTAFENEEPRNQENKRIFEFDKEAGEEYEANVDSSHIDKTKELEVALKESKDKHLRLLAEFENYKKRTTRERLDLLNGASRDVILALLPILDDFDRAKKSEQFSEGVNMVYNRLYAVLQSQGLKIMESTGQAFDPEWHDAITEIPAPDESQKGKVIDTVEKGYLLNDKIIRHAKVVVGN